MKTCKLKGRGLGRWKNKRVKVMNWEGEENITGCPGCVICEGINKSLPFHPEVGRSCLFSSYWQKSQWIIVDNT